MVGFSKLAISGQQGNQVVEVLMDEAGVLWAELRHQGHQLLEAPQRSCIVAFPVLDNRRLEQDQKSQMRVFTRSWATDLGGILVKFQGCIAVARVTAVGSERD